MQILGIDIESYCDLDLTEVGVFGYVEHHSFEVLMIAWAIDDDPVQIIDIKGGDPIGIAFYSALRDPNIIKQAYNAQFERTALQKHFRSYMPASEWRCTMVHALELGFPMGLGFVAEVLGLPSDQQKMKSGKALIVFFCKPCKATKKNGGLTRNLPSTDPDRWKIFLSYCIQDVVTERALRHKLEKFPLVQSEQELWEIDQNINEIGIRLDRYFVAQAVALDTRYTNDLMAEAVELTQLQNPNSLPQLKAWLEHETQMVITGLTKEDVPKLIAATDNVKVERVLQIRQELAKTSTSKYYAMERSINDDDRIRGTLQFYGANRTGRWAGRLVQVHNLPQNKIPDLRLARELLRSGDFEGFEMLFGDISFTMSQLIRTAFIPSEGNAIYVADFSAIEARMIAWVAGEDWRMEVFNTHGRIYEASAAAAFHVDLDTIVKGHSNYKLRSQGKVLELACGYGGSVGAVDAMDYNNAIPAEEREGMVKAWRAASPKIVALWWAVDKAAIDAVRYPGRITSTHGIEFQVESGILFIRLQSGRSLAYVRPKVVKGKFGRDQIVYEGMNQETKKWQTIDTYGPKLVENIIQALSRDCLCFAIKNLRIAGYAVVMHVHDEVLIDHPMANSDQVMDHIKSIMSWRPSWAPGLPLGADGYACDFYKKD